MLLIAFHQTLPDLLAWSVLPCFPQVYLIEWDTCLDHALHDPAQIKRSVVRNHDFPGQDRAHPWPHILETGCASQLLITDMMYCSGCLGHSLNRLSQRMK